MKKYLPKTFLLLLVIVFCASPLSLFAGTADIKALKDIKTYKQADLLNTDNTLEISGVDETNEIRTFDDKKIFSCVAENGTEITATVYIPADNGNWKEVKTYSSTVGASGLFSTTIDFNLGENIIVFKASKDNKLSSCAFTVKRKDAEIRDKIKEQPISLPVRLAR